MTSLHSVVLPQSAPLLNRSGWAVFSVVLLVLCVGVPVLNLMVPIESVLHVSDYAVALLGKMMCYAVCALAMDLIWGYTCLLYTSPSPRD